jgi:hypothetical protein
MPDSTTLLVVIGGLLVVLTVGGIVWWVNRTPTGRRSDRAADLPLYSVTMSEEMNDAPAPRLTAPRAVSAVEPAEPRVQRAAKQDVVKSGGGSAGGKKRETPRATPAVAPSPTADDNADDTTSRRAQIREFTTPAPRVKPRDRVPPAPAPAPPPAVVAPPSPVVTAAAPAGERAITAHGVPGTEVEGHLVKFSVPQDGTLQFLPGRLQILDGQDAGREVRFVRVPGPDGTTVTFGRSDGPAYRHIQLREATVSRAHARMRLEEGSWHLTNLSDTNPVVVNGRTMAAGEEMPVADGDRIEMGEVVFGFRSR